MATTVTAALVANGCLYMGHVGDSRAYLLRAGWMTPLTEDHSLVADQMRRGLLRPEEAPHHPMRHILTQTVGLGESIAPLTRRQPIKAGDRLLLCTDGLTGFLGDEAIARVIERVSGGSAVDALIAEAIEAGSNDNITALLVTFERAENSQ